MSMNSRLLAIYVNILYDHNKECDTMIYPSIDNLLQKVGSKYLLVNVVAKRAHQMRENNHYQMKDNDYKSKKEIGKALEEVSENLIHLD